MRVNKIAQPFLIGMAIIATLFVYNEGFNQYNEIRVINHNYLKNLYFPRIPYFVIYWIKTK